MSMIDPLGDMLTRIRNAQMRRKNKVSTPGSRLRGRVYEYRGAKLVPTFHPAFLLRNPSCRREVWEDMKKVRALLNGEEAA